MSERNDPQPTTTSGKVQPANDEAIEVDADPNDERLDNVEESVERAAW